MPQGWWKSGLLLLALTPLQGFALFSRDYPAPRQPGGSILLENTANLNAYSPEYKQPLWVFYGLGGNELRSCVERGNNFHADSRLPSNQASQLADYKGSGFDRGHLSPAGDNRWSADAMRESFALSNMSPQVSRFNSGIWAKLENLVRAWAKNLGGLWVATGPILKDGLPTIGASRVAVPEYFYKVLATREEGRTKAVAFLLPTDASGDLSRFEMTVDKLEEITGLDFLSGMDGEEEAESHYESGAWDTKAKFQYFPCNAVAPGALEWSWGI
jgi:endonuclease G